MIIGPFNTKGVTGTEAIVVFFDLEGFSSFFMQPDVHRYAIDYLNIVFEAVDLAFCEEPPYWLPKESQAGWRPISCRPDYVKFTGDGGLLIWIAAMHTEPIPLAFKLKLTGFLWALKSSFDEVTKKAQNVVPLAKLPKRIRFGLTGGTVYGLTRGLSNVPEDYIGFCINLAARLQDYCREIGFIVSARIVMDEFIIKKLNWIKTTAIDLKGFEKEIVYVDKLDFDALPEDKRKSLFA
jgi:class 3 adenylate cyclase